MRYTAQGKQVMRDRQHFADAATEQAAQIIVTALNAMRGEAPRSLTDDEGNPEREYLTWHSIPIPTTHRARVKGTLHTVTQQSDEFACSCGMRWDVSDGEDHP